MKELDEYDCETCIIQNKSVQIPRFLVENERLFLSLMSMETWNKLSSESQQELMKLLPEKSDIDDKEIVHQLLNKDNFYFGNPIKKFHRRLHSGSFHPDISTFSSLCNRAKYKDYLLRQKDHFSQLVVDILPSRQILLDVASLLPQDVPLKLGPLSSRNSFSTLGNDLNRDVDFPSKRRVLSRASLEYYRALAEVRQDVADDGETSSEDEAFPEEAPLRLKARGFSSSDPAVFDIRRRPAHSVSMGNARGEAEEEDALERPSRRRFCVMDTLAPEVDPVSNDEIEDATMQRVGSTISPSTSSCIDDGRYKLMLKNHGRKRRKKATSASKYYCPDLDTDGIDLSDVIGRTEISTATADDEDSLT